MDHLLVDGFNLLHVARQMGKRPLFQDVKSMVFHLEHYAALKGAKLTVVLDGSRFKSEIPDSKILSFHCSNNDEQADTVIERIMAAADPERKLSWVLVTDDHALSQMAAGMGLRRMRARNMIQDLMKSKNQSNGKKKPSVPQPSPKPFNTPFKDLL